MRPQPCVAPKGTPGRSSPARPLPANLSPLVSRNSGVSERHTDLPSSNMENQEGFKEEEDTNAGSPVLSTYNKRAFGAPS